MEQNNRKFDDYTVLTSFCIGEYEIALCESPKAPKDERYLCGYIENNGVFEQINDCIGSDSFADIATCYGERIAEKAEEVQKTLERIQQNVGDDTVITASDCLPFSHEDCIEGKIIVLRDDILRPEYKRSSNQLMLCTGGFGAQANARGRTCYATHLYDASKTQCRREDILGVMPEERLPEWAKNGLEAIRQQSTQIHRKKDTRGDR